MRRLVLAALGLAAAVPPPAASQQAVTRDSFVAVRDADPLELARVVQAHGDGAVHTRLTAKTPLPVRLAAIRAAPWMRVPERALEPLAAIARGRDPDLAPAAARAAWRIARQLDAASLDRREARGTAIRSAAEQLRALAEKNRVRADIRRAAGYAAEALEAAGVRF